MKVLDAELMAAMDLKEARSQLLEATLQEKESQLEQLTELQKVGPVAFACTCHNPVLE